MKRIKITFIITIIISVMISLFSSTNIIYAASLSIDKSAVQPGETVTATISADWKEQEGGWVGLYKKESNNASWITYKKLNFDSSTLKLSDTQFPVKVNEPGEYEFRMFKDYWGTKKIASTSFSVTYSPSSTVSANPSYVYEGDIITAKYEISKQDGEDTAGWVALCKYGSPEGDYLYYKKTGGVSGNYEVAAPSAGNPADETKYEFRLYKDYFGTWKLATSNTIIVVKKYVDHGKDSRARFNTLTGEVFVSSDAGHQIWKPATLKTILRVGDHVKTGPDSSTVIQLEDMSNFVMNENSEIVLQTPPKQETKVGLVMGNIWVNTKKILNNGTMEIEMGQAVAGIKGTTFICEQKDNTSTLKVIEGKVLLTSKVNGKSVYVSGSETVTATSSDLKAKGKFDTKSETKIWSLVADITPPRTPVINKITSKSTAISGKAEAGTTILVKSGASILGKTIVKPNGLFTLAIKKQKPGVILLVSSVDKANNECKPVSIKVAN